MHAYIPFRSGDNIFLIEGKVTNSCNWMQQMIKLICAYVFACCFLNLLRRAETPTSSSEHQRTPKRH